MGWAGHDGPSVRLGRSAHGLWIKTAVAANFLTGDSTKVLVLEYNQAVANVVAVTQLGTTLGSDTDVYLTTVAPRHDGTLNVLLGDGSVTNYPPQTIDPTVAANRLRFWLPGIFQK